MIVFDKVLPYPLVGVIDSDTEIWDTLLEIEEGKNYMMSAASGRGKSTMLSIIFGLRKDYHGTAYIDDKVIAKTSPNEWTEYRRNKISIVFQDLRLFLNHSVWENLKIKAELYNTSNDELFKLVERLRIKHLLEHKCSHISYGERQRVAIIRALLQPFKYLLLDEPFSHLDAANIDICKELILEKCAEKNAGMIMGSLGDTYGIKFDRFLNL